MGGSWGETFFRAFRTFFYVRMTIGPLPRALLQGRSAMDRIPGSLGQGELHSPTMATCAKQNMAL